jgi:UDP-N-acetylglucosamine/UDP-N-acetylgalactosamine 4-epimerase
MFEKPFHQGHLNEYSFLVTGGAGFIGSNIIHYLVKHGAEKIRVLDNLSTGNIHNLEPFEDKIELIKGSIEDFSICQKACEGINIVLHQAALGSVPRSIEFPIATNTANVTGFLNMITAAKDGGVKRLVYASSSSVYGDSKQLPKVEENLGNPLSPYAVSKKVNELYAEVFHRVYGMEIIGLRYFNIYGPNQSPTGAYAAAIPLFMNAFLRNEPPIIHGDGEQTRDFTFVENAVQANIKAAFTSNSDAFGQVFNVACGERTSIKDTCRILKKYSGSEADPIHKEARQGDVRDSLADISKAKNILGYNPEVFFDEGLKNTLDWFKNSRYFKG